MQRRNFFVLALLMMVSDLLGLGAGLGLGRAQAQTVTYRETAPIFLNKCAACHRPGDAAPFSLLTYEEVVKRISFIKEVINKGYMPPWKADPHYRDFANTRFLTEEEKSTILRWIDAKAPRGDDKETGRDRKGGKAEPVKGTDGSGDPTREREELLRSTTYSRKPDLRLTVDTPVVIKGDNTEKFIVYKIPFEFDAPRNIEAVEFYTTNKKILHHVNYGFYEVADSAMNIFGGRSSFNTDEIDRSHPDIFVPLEKKMIYYTGWIPGSSFESYPKGFGWAIPRRGVLILTAHYSAAAADEIASLGVNLFFRKDPIERPVQIISLGSGGIAENDITPPFYIPANRVSTFHLQVKTQEEQSLMYVWPHMHLAGKEFYAYAVTPGGDTIRLVHIPDWDFRWQELYKFKKLIRVPKGSVINMDCTYDNTTNNPFNPNTPPKGIFSFGDMRSTNEMMTLLLVYTPYREGDENISLGE